LERKKKTLELQCKKWLKNWDIAEEIYSINQNIYTQKCYERSGKKNPRRNNTAWTTSTQREKSKFRSI